MANIERLKSYTAAAKEQKWYNPMTWNSKRWAYVILGGALIWAVA